MLFVKITDVWWIERIWSKDYTCVVCVTWMTRYIIQQIHETPIYRRRRRVDQSQLSWQSNTEEIILVHVQCQLCQDLRQDQVFDNTILLCFCLIIKFELTVWNYFCKNKSVTTFSHFMSITMLTRKYNLSFCATEKQLLQHRMTETFGGHLIL